MMCWKATGGIVSEHLPPDRATMPRTLDRKVPLPLIPAYLPVPLKILTVPCWLAVNRQVFGLKVWGPVPVECRTLTVPAGNTNLSVTFPIGWSTPGAVKTPKAMTGRVLAVAEALTDWKCSVPEMAGPVAGDAPAGTASHRAAAAAAAAAMARERFRFNCFSFP